MQTYSVNESLESLLEGCRKNHSKSQEMLYQNFFGFAMRVCLRYASNYEEAIEILNDGFMKVFTKLHLYDPELSFHGWLRKIMITTALNHLKKYKKHNNYLDLEKAKNYSNEENVIQKIEFKEVSDLIQYLPPLHRAVFNLYVIDGYSHEEISEMLKISESNSKTSLLRARNRLKQLLKQSFKDEYAKYS